MADLVTGLAGDQECGVQELTDKSRRSLSLRRQLPLQAENFIPNRSTSTSSWGWL